MEPPDAMAAAYAEMDDRCVAFLVRQLEWKPSILKPKLNRILASVIHREPFEDSPDRRFQAAGALAQLGSRARPAIPILNELSQSTNTPRAKFIRSAATAALIRLGSKSLDACMDKLLDPNNSDWEVYALSTWPLGTNAAATIPRLVHTFEATTNDEVRGRIAFPLRFIQSQPELCVPVLKVLLGHTNGSVRYNAAVGLGKFGAPAKSAWSDLAAHLTDNNSAVREAATNALERIDPEAARRLLTPTP